jgi:hypothetical protein
MLQRIREPLHGRPLVLVGGAAAQIKAKRVLDRIADFHLGAVGELVDVEVAVLSLRSTT